MASFGEGADCTRCREQTSSIGAGDFTFRPFGDVSRSCSCPGGDQPTTLPARHVRGERGRSPRERPTPGLPRGGRSCLVIVRSELWLLSSNADGSLISNVTPWMVIVPVARPTRLLFAERSMVMVTGPPGPSNVLVLLDAELALMGPVPVITTSTSIGTCMPESKSCSRP